MGDVAVDEVGVVDVGGPVPLRPVELSVVVPAHDSALVVEDTVRRLVERLRGRRAEVVLVENGSTDDTADRCAALAAGWDDPDVDLVVLRSEKGMGAALRTGVLASRGATVLLTADDLPFGFDDVDAFQAMPEPRPAAVIGSKAHPASVVERGPARAALTWGFGVLRRWVVGMRTGDPQGTFLVDGALLRDLAPALVEQGFLFSTELAMALELRGITPVEVPVRLSRGHGDHTSRVRRADVVSMATGLWRLRGRRGVLRGAARPAGARADGPAGGLHYPGET